MRALKMSRSTRWMLGIVGLAAAALISGVALAASSEDNAVYYGCYGPDGNLRVVQSASACKSNEKAIVWNQTGPRGEQGLQGEQGLPGPAGAPPLAYAYVANGVLDTTRSSNVVSMTTKIGRYNPVYCFDLPSVPKSVVATAAFGADQGFSNIAAAVAGTTGMSLSPCDPGTDGAVVYGSYPTGSNGFFVVFN